MVFEVHGECSAFLHHDWTTESTYGWRWGCGMEMWEAGLKNLPDSAQHALLCDRSPSCTRQRAPSVALDFGFSPKSFDPWHWQKWQLSVLGLGLWAMVCFACVPVLCHAMKRPCPRRRDRVTGQTCNQSALSQWYVTEVCGCLLLSHSWLIEWCWTILWVLMSHQKCKSQLEL
jgi:hypothetical protein